MVVACISVGSLLDDFLFIFTQYVSKENYFKAILSTVMPLEFSIIYMLNILDLFMNINSDPT